MVNFLLGMGASLAFLVAAFLIWYFRDPSPPGRRGIIEEIIVYGRGKAYEAKVQYEVEEVERVGRLSRVKIISVTGVPSLYKGTVMGLLNEWHETKDVIWLDEEASSTP